MDLSRVKENRLREELEDEKKKGQKETAEESVFVWPDSFYESKDGGERMDFLLRAEREGLEPEENETRKRLLNIRYKRGGGDKMLAAWLTLLYFANFKDSRLSLFAKREIRTMMQDFGMGLLERKEASEDMIYLELYHMLDLYIDTCLEDKKYGGILMGMGRMTEENIRQKIGLDFYRASHQVHEYIQRQRGFPLIKKAARDCFVDRFADGKDIFAVLAKNGEEAGFNQ